MSLTVVYPRGGEWGSGPPTFFKNSPRDFPKNAIKSVPQRRGGGGVRQIDVGVVRQMADLMSVSLQTSLHIKCMLLHKIHIKRALPLFSESLESVVAKNFLGSSAPIPETPTFQGLGMPLVTDSWFSNVYKRKITISIFLDLKKAFDSLDHKILLSRLSKYAIDETPHQWFTSYLTDRI